MRAPLFNVVDCTQNTKARTTRLNFGKVEILQNNSKRHVAFFSNGNVWETKCIFFNDVRACLSGGPQCVSVAIDAKSVA